VDLGSAAGLSDPLGGVARLAARTGQSFPAIAAARERTEARVQAEMRALAGTPTPPGVSVCVFGSWARGELTDGSDDDWALLVTGAPAQDDPAVAEAVGALLAAARARLGGEEREPGAQGIFGVPFAVDALVGNIGLDADTNTNTTRRMLLALESRELCGSARGDAVDRILARYLQASRTDFQPPRFLLNDLVRYWRTICVDFEGKRAAAGGEDPKWAMRNAKLRTSRKLLFAGGLVPLLLCRVCVAGEMQGFLRRWFDAPPLDRLAAAFSLVEADEVGVRTLAAYDRWLGLMADPAARTALAAVPPDAPESSPVFATARTIGEEFENGLLSLLFSTPLGQVTRRYAIF
jgi:hypothetical protein